MSKTNTGTVLLLIGGGIALWYYAGLARAGELMQVVFKTVTFNNLTSLNIILGIQNVSNTTININSLVGTVTMNGSTIGSISSFTPTSVPGNSEQQLSVQFDLSVLGLPGIISNIINNPSQQYTFAITGNANVNGLPVPISDTEQFSL